MLHFAWRVFWYVKTCDGNHCVHPGSDTAPITPTSNGNGESTPLRGSKLVDKLALTTEIAAGLTQHKKSESYSKFKVNYFR